MLAVVVAAVVVVVPVIIVIWHHAGQSKSRPTNKQGIARCYPQVLPGWIFA